MSNNHNSTYDDVELVQPQKEYTAQERAALITHKLAMGAEMSTAEIAKRTGTTASAASYLISKISRVTPVYHDDGKWKMLDE